jgi:hypothetical protein
VVDLAGELPPQMAIDIQIYETLDEKQRAGITHRSPHAAVAHGASL